MITFCIFVEKIAAMNQVEDVLSQIKAVIKQHAPEETAILYGSRARGDARPDSDWDILILSDTKRITYEDRDNLREPLEELGANINADISLLMRTVKEWSDRSFTIFYKHVEEEGILLQSQRGGHAVMTISNEERHKNVQLYINRANEAMGDAEATANVFYLHFVARGAVSRDRNKLYSQLFDLRLNGDYESLYP